MSAGYGKHKWLSRLIASMMIMTSVFMPAYTYAVGDSAISQGFKVEGDVVTGTIVSFTDKTSQNAVSAANVDNVERLAGIVADKALVELSNGGSETTVVTSGITAALVSDINGDIKKGDVITASPLNGIGMKVTDSSQVVGTAQSNLSEATQIKTRQVTASDGTQKTVRIGSIPVQVNVTYYQSPEDKNALLPSFLQRFAETIVGREVSPIRVLVAFILLIVGIGGAAVLLYSSVRSSIISIGRNPLSARAVHRSLFEVGAISVGALTVMVIAVYLVLVI